MNRGRRICESIHVGVLGVWLGALVMTGVAAAVIFPTMKSLDPRLPGYEGYTGSHWMLAGGSVANRLFVIGDVVQFTAMLAAGATFGLGIMFFGLPSRKPLTVIRATLLLGLVGVLSYHLLVLAPRMAVNLDGFWAAAKAGDQARAETLRAAFDADHPTARSVLSCIAVLLLGALAAGVWSATGGAYEGSAES